MKKTIFSAALSAAAILATSCGSTEQGNITEGNKSQMDSLSYALGSNVAYSSSRQMADIPFNYDAIIEGMRAAAFEKNELSHEDAISTLQDYFMTKRAERAASIEAKRNTADSTALANGADTAEVVAARQALKADADMFENEEERKDVSYAFGIDLGTNIKSADLPIQIYWLASGLDDVYQGEGLMTGDEAIAYLNNYISVTMPAERAALSEANLAEIEKQSGVQKTESGLLYRIEEMGDTTVMATNDEDMVKVFYTGKLIRTDKTFDTNRFADRDEEQKTAMLEQDPDAASKDEPIEFPLNRVIPGWTEGMKLVGKGGRISLWIPSELAYGTQGAGRMISANEALFFDVELVDVTPAEAAIEE